MSSETRIIRARTTKDIDATLRRQLEEDELKDILRQAASLDLGDWFEFEVGEPSAVATGAPLGGARFPIRCLLDGREFERFHFDLGQGDPLVQEPESVGGPPLLEFADIAPAIIPCYPLPAQVAEKFHAYTRPYSSGESSRVRDFVDILLIGSFATLDSSGLTRAFQATFGARATHPLPTQVPRPPARWSGSCKRRAEELNLDWRTLADATSAAARFLDPILQQTATGMWDSSSWSWK